MSRPRKSSSTTSKKFKVGDRVRFKMSIYEHTGTIVEDRGPLGAGGRNIYGIRAFLDVGLERVFELAEDALERA